MQKILKNYVPESSIALIKLILSSYRAELSLYRALVDKERRNGLIENS